MRRMHTDEEIKALALNVAAASIAALGITETDDGLNVEGKLTADEIVENMEGYSYTRPTGASTFNIDYAGAVKNGNKLTLAVSLIFIPAATLPAGANLPCGTFYVPSEIASKLIGSKAYGINNVLAFNFLSIPQVESQSYINGNLVAVKVGQSGNGVELRIYSGGQVVAGTSYKMRAEITFLLSESLATQG